MGKRNQNEPGILTLRSVQVILENSLRRGFSKIGIDKRKVLIYLKVQEFKREAMSIDISRDTYLKELIDRRESGLIKIVSGVRRCGKSYLLNKIFRGYLVEDGVAEANIISVALDDIISAELREPRRFYDYVLQKMQKRGMNYLLVDELQELPRFEEVMNGLLRIPNLDIYVTGSNSRFLTRDVVTEFRGRGDEVRVYPLSFAEFYNAYGQDKMTALRDYLTYGGMPYTLNYTSAQRKQQYLRNLFSETYIKDIIERHSLHGSEGLDELIDLIASGIGGLTNPAKLQRRFKSIANSSLSSPTINSYIVALQDSFIIHRAKRYDIRGKRYINTPFKLYFADLGLRNARLDFRQQEPTHAMENLIYNELLLRGYSVDIGELHTSSSHAPYEVDFVVNSGSERVYIQSAWSLPDAHKMEQEKRSLRLIPDSFAKVIIVNDAINAYYDEDGILILPLLDFLLTPPSSALRWPL